MRMRARAAMLGATLAAALLAAACGEGEAKEMKDVRNSGPGATIVRPSFSPISSATVPPTATRTATPTATTAATATRTATPTPTPAATATPTATP